MMYLAAARLPPAIRDDADAQVQGPVLPLTRTPRHCRGCRFVSTMTLTSFLVLLRLALKLLALLI
jgi:hypothetical protein